MRLFHSQTSPFVKKVLVAAWEVGAGRDIDLVACKASHVNRDAAIMQYNPMGQVPTLVLEDGSYLADSRVICEYLNHRYDGVLFPEPGEQRWRALRLDAMATTMMEAAVLARLEIRIRPETHHYQPWVDAQFSKLSSGLAALENEASVFDQGADIAAVSVASLLSLLDRRFPEVAWREEQPDLAAFLDRFELRESMQRTPILAGVTARPKQE